MICDTYLSVSTPVQVAAPALIEAARRSATGCSSACARNYRALRSLAAAHPADRGPADRRRLVGGAARAGDAQRGGSRRSICSSATACSCIPGFFFDFPHEAFLVVSLLPEPDAFAEGVRRVLERADG